MAKPKWGTKRTCEGCGDRFYDLHRHPAVCPYCGAKMQTDPVAGPKRGGAAEEKIEARTAEPVKIESRGTDDAFEEKSDEDKIEVVKVDSDLIEDTSDLGEDEDDIAEAMEHVDDEVVDGI